MDSKSEPPIATEVEDSLRRLDEMIQWRIMGDEIRARRRRLAVIEDAEQIMAAQEQVSPELKAKRERLLKLLRAQITGTHESQEAKGHS